MNFLIAAIVGSAVAFAGGMLLGAHYVHLEWDKQVAEQRIAAAIAASNAKIRDEEDAAATQKVNDEYKAQVLAMSGTIHSLLLRQRAASSSSLPGAATSPAVPNGNTNGPGVTADSPSSSTVDRVLADSDHVNQTIDALTIGRDALQQVAGWREYARATKQIK